MKLVVFLFLVLSSETVFSGNNAVATLRNNHSKGFLIMSQDWIGANCIDDATLGYQCDMKFYSGDLSEDIEGRGYINDTNCDFRSLDHSIHIYCEDPTHAILVRKDLVTGELGQEKFKVHLLD
jgi:hypothetical protein